MLQSLQEKMDMIIDMDKIPFPDIPNAIIGKVIECGSGIYMRIVEDIKKEDYKEYLKTFESAGFVKYTESEDDVRYRVYNAAFRKNSQIVTVTYNGYWNRIHITTYVDNEPPKQNVSIMEHAEDYGAGNYVTIMEHVNQSDYREYQDDLKKLGFVKHVDNDKGLCNKIFSTTYVKENVVLTITYVAKTEKLYISACEDLPLSEYLFPSARQRCKNGNIGKTTLHMLKMAQFGNSFIFQLKNNHFIISDGGLNMDLSGLLDYLEKLTPEGEKPTIEAWFVSHGHADHCGVFETFLKEPIYSERIYVEGLYYNEPNDNVINLDPGTRVSIVQMKEAVKMLRTTEDEETKIYRPQTGQRYYFDDITVDIILGQEQLPLREYSGDFNDSSTWCMFTIEGQKCLLGGDGDSGGINFILEAYEQDDMKLDIFTLLHHGHNTRERFTDFCSVKTVLVTNGSELPEYRAKENEHLKEVSKEWISWKDGTKVLGFPYETGSYTTQQ